MGTAKTFSEDIATKIMMTALYEFGMIIFQFYGVFTSATKLAFEDHHPVYAEVVLLVYFALPAVFILEKDGTHANPCGDRIREYFRRVFFIEATFAFVQ